MTPPEIHLLERGLANSFGLLSLSASEFRAWDNCRFTDRRLCRTGQYFVIWHGFLDQPKVAGSVRIGLPTLTPEEGLTADVEVNYDDKTYCVKVSHYPVGLVGKRLFAHTPFMPQLRYIPYTHKSGEQSMTLQFPIVFKAEGGVQRPKEDSLTITPIGAFRTQFPQFKDLVL